MGGMTSVVSRAATLASRILLLHIFVLSGGAGRGAMQVCSESTAFQAMFLSWSRQRTRRRVGKLSPRWTRSLLVSGATSCPRGLRVRELARRRCGGSQILFLKAYRQD